MFPLEEEEWFDVPPEDGVSGYPAPEEWTDVSTVTGEWGDVESKPRTIDFGEWTTDVVPAMFSMFDESFGALPQMTMSRDDIVKSIYEGRPMPGQTQINNQLNRALEGLSEQGIYGSDKIQYPWGTETTVEEAVQSMGGAGPSITTSAVGIIPWLFGPLSGTAGSSAAATMGYNLTTAGMTSNITSALHSAGVSYEDAQAIVDDAWNEITISGLAEGGTEALGSFGVGKYLKHAITKQLGDKAGDKITKKVLNRLGKGAGVAGVFVAEESLEEGIQQTVEEKQLLDIEKRNKELGLELGGEPYSLGNLMQNWGEAVVPAAMYGGPTIAIGGLTQQAATNMPDLTKYMPEAVKDMVQTGGEFLGYKGIAPIVAYINELEQRIETETDSENKKNLQSAVADLRIPLQKLESPESYSAQAKVTENFKGRHMLYASRLWKPTAKILDKIKHQKYWFTGEMGTRIDPQLQKTIIQKLHKAQNAEQEYSKLNNEQQKLVDEVIPQLKKALQRPYRFAKLVKDKDRRLEMGQVKDYLTLAMNARNLGTKQGKEMFIGAMKRKEERKAKDDQLSHVEIEAIYDDIMANQGVNMLVQPLSRKQLSMRNINPGKRNWEKARKMQYDDFNEAEQEYLLENNLETLLENYMYSVAKRTAAAHTFGNKGQVLEEYVKRAQEGMEHQGGIPEKVINRIYDLHDASMGIYRQFESPAFRSLNKVNQAVQAISHLGLATISSLSEVAWVIERYGLSGFIRGMPYAASYAANGLLRTIHKDLPKTLGIRDEGKGKEILTDIGYGLHSSINERMAQMFAGDFSQGLDLWFRSPFGGMLTHWTNLNRVWAAGAGLNMLQSWGNHMEKYGTYIDPKDRSIDARKAHAIATRLAELGLSEEALLEMMRRTGGKLSLGDEQAYEPITGEPLYQRVWDKENQVEGEFALDENGEKIPLAVGRIRLEPHTKQDLLPDGEPKEIRHYLSPVLQHLVDDIVINPRPTNKPLWMSDPHMAIFAQFKSFPVVFGNTVMKRVAKTLSGKHAGCDLKVQAAINTIGAIGFAYGIAAMANMIKDAIKDKDIEADFPDVLAQSGMLGMYEVALGPFVGEQRYGSDPFTQLAGPTVGMATSFAKRDPMDVVTSALGHAFGPVGVAVESD